ncbi:Synaptotagmin-6 [Holothuria leucospilota]|uniref:Synaptotagmin-6 n=1 Tax=Holothuria leucospilota TaxID=206669 RepID=A0A9Q1BRC4_HOLLE|nr:Synaptotagmin-6 [Holothuria leucospilota]
MHIHERTAREDVLDPMAYNHIDKQESRDSTGVTVPLRSITIPICFTALILVVAYLLVYCTRRAKQQKERASEVVTIHRKRYVSNAYDSDSDAESVMNWQGKSGATRERSETHSGSSSPTLSARGTPPQVSPMKILPRQATVPLLQRQKQDTFRQQRQLSLQLNLANIEFSVKNLSAGKRSQSSSLGSLNPDLYQDKHVEESTEDSCGRLYFSLFYDHPTETLNVHVNKATDLTAKDFCGTSDPYVKIYLYPDRRKKFQTKVVRKTCNPEFDERFAFQIPYNEISKRTLKFTIYDFDRFSRHDLIGEVTLTNMLQDHDLGVETEFIRNVVKGSAAEKVDLGEILFSLCYLPTACRLTLTVIKARNLKAMDITGASDPYVKVSLMSLGKRIKKKKTAVKKNTLNPIYNEALVFDVTPETMDSVCFVIAVVDHDWVGHSELIGVCETGPFCVGQGKDHWEEMMSNPRTPIAHWYQLQESAPSFSAAVVAGGLKNCMGNSQQSSD